MEQGAWIGLLTVAEVARSIGLSKPHVYSLAKSGAIPSIKFNRAVRFYLRDVEAFIEAHRRAGKEA